MSGDGLGTLQVHAGPAKPRSLREFRISPRESPAGVASHAEVRGSSRQFAPTARFVFANVR